MAGEIQLPVKRVKVGKNDPAFVSRKEKSLGLMCKL